MTTIGLFCQSDVRVISRVRLVSVPSCLCCTRSAFHRKCPVVYPFGSTAYGITVNLGTVSAAEPVPTSKSQGPSRSLALEAPSTPRSFPLSVWPDRSGTGSADYDNEGRRLPREGSATPARPSWRFPTQQRNQQAVNRHPVRFNNQSGSVPAAES